MVETMNPAVGGGGGIDNTPRPVDFEEPDDESKRREEAVRRALPFLIRYGSAKPQYIGHMPPEFAKLGERKAILGPSVGEAAIAGYNQFDYEPSEN